MIALEHAPVTSVPVSRRRAPDRTVSRHLRKVGATVIVSLTLAVTACTTTHKERVDDIGPGFVPRNVTTRSIWPMDVTRVAVLPTADATHRLPIEFVASYDAPWLEALQRSQRAEFVSVDRETYANWTGGPRAPTSAGLLPPQLPDRIRTTTGADAALLLDITHCSPYPPLSLGLRAKLVRLDTGDVIWAADELFDSKDPLVSRSAKRHARAGMLSRDSNAISILQSPSMFAGYVSDTLAATLPPR